MNPSASSIDVARGHAQGVPRTHFTPISAVYRISCNDAAVESVARDIALEQTVEVPEALIASAAILDEVVGRVEAIQPAPGEPGSFLVTVAYNVKLAGCQIPQLLNLVYGNCSLKKHVALADLDLPDEFVKQFRGPNFGTHGIREMLGVYDRPLLATALKPVGSTPSEFAAMAYDFCLGGGDLVKDDHNLHDASFDDFRERVGRCQQAVLAANRQTGRNALYLPNLLAPVDQLNQLLEFVVSAGIRGILVASFLLGLDVTRSIAEKYPLIVMAHPTMTGAFFSAPTHGIDPGLLLGKLFRLIGADISIFPNFGGRFTFTEGDCRGISDQLAAPLGSLKPALPAPAGGMQFENLPQMAEQYGPDAVFLIGGALLSHSHSLEESTREFLQRIEEDFPPRAGASAAEFVSACELQPRHERGIVSSSISRRLPFNDNFTWDGRHPVVYKSGGELPFREVTRHELLGQHGEQTAFDLRYFQIEPGGHSSLEKHEHTHAIVCIRGEGTLQCGAETLPLKHLDVAYVPAWEVHQLRNEGTEPFGFFCIVDHDRDRPRAP